MTDLTKAPVASDIIDGDITMLVRTINGEDVLYQVPASVIRGKQGIQGIQGIQGEQGEQGLTGAGWSSGNGLPVNNSNTVENSLYINLLNYDIYEYSSNKWSLVGNIKGQQGIQGTRGSKWSSGQGAPIDTGNYLNGDMYLDTNNGNVYNYTTVWSLQGNIIGPQGIQGEQGIQGPTTTWYFGNGSPVITGIENDKYLNTENSDVYSYNNGTWGLIGNIRGLQGSASEWYYGNGEPSGITANKNDKYIDTTVSDLYDYDGNVWNKIGNIKGQQGEQGIQGIQGLTGPRGSIWRYGNVSPPTITNANLYDVYLNEITGDVYQYISGTWVSIGNIRGPAGSFTNDGSDNILISNATFYNSGSLKFLSDGDNNTVDSSIVPSGGKSGTQYQGTLTFNANKIVISNEITTDNGNITSDGLGNLTVSGLNIGTEPVSTQNWVNNNFLQLNTNTNQNVYGPVTFAGNIAKNLPVGVPNQYQITASGSDRWNIGSDGHAESGTSVGSNFVIARFDNTGKFIDVPFAITRENGLVSVFTEMEVPDVTVFTGMNALNARSADGRYATNTALSAETARASRAESNLQSSKANISGGNDFNGNQILNNNLTVNGKTSLDNGAITTNGSGNLNVTGLISTKTPSDVPGTSTGTNVPTTYWVDQNYAKLSGGNKFNGNQTFSGTITFTGTTGFNAKIANAPASPTTGVGGDVTNTWWVDTFYARKTDLSGAETDIKNWTNNLINSSITLSGQYYFRTDGYTMWYRQASNATDGIIDLYSNYNVNNNNVLRIASDGSIYTLAGGSINLNNPYATSGTSGGYNASPEVEFQMSGRGAYVTLKYEELVGRTNQLTLAMPSFNNNGGNTTYFWFDGPSGRINSSFGQFAFKSDISITSPDENTLIQHFSVGSTHTMARVNFPIKFGGIPRVIVNATQPPGGTTVLPVNPGGVDESGFTAVIWSGDTAWGLDIIAIGPKA